MCTIFRSYGFENFVCDLKKRLKRHKQAFVENRFFSTPTWNYFPQLDIEKKSRQFINIVICHINIDFLRYFRNFIFLIQLIEDQIENRPVESYTLSKRK